MYLLKSLAKHDKFLIKQEKRGDDLVEKDDWRLLVNNGAYLRKAYINPTDGEEIYKHAPQLKKCAFCMEPVHNDPHQWWFIPIDFSCCICEDCFNDFKEMFEWKKLDGWDIDWGN